MTPARFWRLELDGIRHSVAFSPGATTDRPNQIKVDRTIVSIDWHRAAGNRGPWREPTEYEAAFDIHGRRGVLRWYPSQHERSWVSHVVTIGLVVVVGAFLGDNNVGGTGAGDGDVSLTVGGRLVPVLDEFDTIEG